MLPLIGSLNWVKWMWNKINQLLLIWGDPTASKTNIHLTKKKNPYPQCKGRKKWASEHNKTSKFVIRIETREEDQINGHSCHKEGMNSRYTTAEISSNKYNMRENIMSRTGNTNVHKAFNLCAYYRLFHSIRWSLLRPA